MTEPSEPTEPPTGTTRRPWVRVVTLLVLGAFVLSIVVSSLSL